MNDLKKCPFCGSKAQLLIVPGRVAHWVVRCEKGCCNTCQYISDHDAEEAWNKRTAEEIVQCKDCKHSVMTQYGEVKYCKYWQGDEDGNYGGDPLYLDGDFYCSFAEPKATLDN